MRPSYSESVYHVVTRACTYTGASWEPKPNTQNHYSANTVTTAATRYHAQAMETSITSALGNFAHGIGDQFAELSSIMQHSLTDISKAINAGVVKPTVHQTSDDTDKLPVTKPHVSESHLACADNHAGPADQTSNGTHQ
jgi:hypothetical protein